MGKSGSGLEVCHQAELLEFDILLEGKLGNEYNNLRSHKSTFSMYQNKITIIRVYLHLLFKK